MENKNKYAPIKGKCKICGKPADTQSGYYCGDECRDKAGTFLVSETESLYRPIKVILGIMQKWGISYSEYIKDRDNWHRATYGGNDGE